MWNESHLSFYKVGYDFKHSEEKSCGDAQHQVITPLLNSSHFSFDENCDVTSETCAVVQPFKTFNVTLTSYDASSSMVLNEFKVDVCKIFKALRNKNTSSSFKNHPMRMKIGMIKFMFMFWGIPLQCPVREKFVYCYKKSDVVKVSSVYQKMIPVFALALKVRVQTITEHNSGSSCMETVLSTVKMNWFSDLPKIKVV